MTTTTILTVAAVVIIALLVWRMMRTIFKFIFIGVIALLAFWWISNGGLGNFIENPTGKLLDISAKYQKCQAADQINDMDCKCWIIPIYKDLRLRYNANEITALETNNKTKLARELTKSIANTRSQINDCLGEKKNNAEKFFKEVKDVVDAASGE
ncbi:MAG: hypothetical protein IPI59_11015 [Sphingobacteriales bacterium]|jgi:hypothetical protein|nr:hypothetical protein [Sphingobacteriales bacterium]MBP9141046.1 hypothetical protein [Chitinophagales bacterium]MDA0200005.1 hypothetical protein [Bacteroidota bacterium]MBK6889436.1 hypothetical protein [Sphingobacteriales bacterium]MBK7528064.1 hypothetical protein [Sphingobacteriales bacterium]